MVINKKVVFVLISLVLASCMKHDGFGQVMVSTDIQEINKAEPRISDIESFFERVESEQLEQAISQRGSWVKVPAGDIELKVPCDYAAPGEFAVLTAKLEKNERMKIELGGCGANIVSID